MDRYIYRIVMEYTLNAYMTVAMVKRFVVASRQSLQSVIVTSVSALAPERQTKK